MNERLRNFCYSQNSINTYKSCPLKFRYKYIDKINWKHDDIDSRDYYENLKLGRDFHLICERYFSDIPLGLYLDEKNSNNKVYEKFSRWIQKIKRLIPISEEYIYLPEYEVRYNIEGYNIQAKYDLVVLGKNSIDIWDWKTESRKIDYKNVENRLQTIIYMFMAKEVIPRLMGDNFNSEDIKMKYYQPEFDNEPIIITYSDEKHNLNRTKIVRYLDMMQKEDYEENKNKKHCKYCEFNKLCNEQDVHYSILEDGIYGT